MKDTNAPSTDQSRKSAVIAMADGSSWNILQPRVKDVKIENIMAGLARTCRWGGQIREDIDFLSVAEHSAVMCIWAIRSGEARTYEEAACIALHDAAEGILGGDMISPLKALNPEYKRIETLTQETINAAFGIPVVFSDAMRPTFKRLDTRIQLDERETVMFDPARTRGKERVFKENPGISMLGVRLPCLSPRAAFGMFAETFLYCLEELPATSPLTPAARDASTALRARGFEPRLHELEELDPASCELGL